MCLGMQRNTHTTGNNLIPISIPIHPLLKIGISETPELKALTSQIRIVTIATTCSYITYTMVYCKGMDIGIKLPPVMWVFL
jgi:hypothetical protein